MAETLFGYLVNRFSSSPENLATEALCFILNNSQHASDALVSFFNHLSIPLSRNLKFDTQSRSEEDNSIPDLVGRNLSGEIHFLGEMKFWAGLTNNQPVSYLKRLSEANGLLLTFVVPRKRIQTIWPELIRRCNAGIVDIEIIKDSTEAKIGIVEGKQFLLLTSWSSILNSIKQTLEIEREIEMVGNISQLQGLCEQMDSSAFLPLQSEDMTSNVSTRFLQYCDITDELIEILHSKGKISLQGLKATPIREGYKRYFVFDGKGCSLEFNALLWKEHRATPVWLGITSNMRWEFSVSLKEKLISLELEEPSRLFQIGKNLYIPIFLKTGFERNEVVDNAIDQILTVFNLISS